MIAHIPWFPISDLIWLGPLAGVLCAVWGGMIGVLGYAFVRKGRRRRLVYGFVYAGGLAGILSCLAGLLGLLTDQPLPIYASLMGLGIPVLIGAGASLFSIGKAYQAVELRRMYALEQ